MIYFTPGPVPIHPETAKAMHDLPYHKSDIYGSVLQSLDSNLKTLFDSQMSVIPFGGSGTTSAEIAMRTLCIPGSHVLVLVNGRFSARWAELAKLFSCNVDILEAQWGDIVTVDVLSEYLSKHQPDSIWITHTETSTGITAPLQEYCTIIGSNAPESLICVDCVSSIVCEDFSMKDYSIDCVIAASQKGLAAPPGLGLLGMSERALEIAIVNSKQKKSFPSMVFNIEQLYTRFIEHIPLYTPPLPIISALNTSTGIILRNRTQYAETLLKQQMRIRSFIKTLPQSFSLQEQFPSRGLTIVHHQDAKEILGKLQLQGFYCASGQDAWSTSAIRIGHMVPYETEIVDSFFNCLSTIALDY